MFRKTKLAVAVLALAASGCTYLEWKPDAGPLYTQPGNNPVTGPFSTSPVTGRDWACKCHCPKGCLQ